MTAKDIDNALRSHFSNNSRYMVSNVYAFDHHYKETDFLVVKENGYTLDLEIKVSFSDFKADFKKDKHNILKNGFVVAERDYARKEDGVLTWYKKGEHIPVFIPNKFYFCVPHTLLDKVKDLIPDYAGLFYLTELGYIRKYKEAKLLHKEKKLKEIESILCRKFYYSYLELKQQKSPTN